jgi:hypothetical protein
MRAESLDRPLNQISTEVSGHQRGGKGAGSDPEHDDGKRVPRGQRAVAPTLEALNGKTKPTPATR